MSNEFEEHGDSDDENEEEPSNCEDTQFFRIQCIKGTPKWLNLEFHDVYDCSSLADVIVDFIEMLENLPLSGKSFSQVERAWNIWIKCNHHLLEHNTFALMLPLDLRNPKDGNLKFILAFEHPDDFASVIKFAISEKKRVKGLEEIAASVVIQHLEDDEDVDKLYLPTPLAQKLKTVFSDYCDYFK